MPPKTFFLPLLIALFTPLFAGTEVEPNEDFHNAGTLPLNGNNCSGVVTQTNDSDLWLFNIPSDGEVTFRLSQSAVPGFSAVQFGAIIIERFGDSAEIIGVMSLDGLTQFTTRKVGLGKRRTGATQDRTYGVIITSGSFTQPRQSYLISATHSPKSEIEHEFNDGANVAQPIALDTPYQGESFSDEDQDWFQFNLASDSDVRIQLQKDSTSPSFGPRHIFILTSSEAPQTPLASADLTIGEFQDSFTEGLPAKDSSGAIITYYVSILPDNGKPVEPYFLTVTATPGKYFEKSPNGSLSTSQALTDTAGGKNLGRISSTADRDIYRFEVAQDGPIQIELSKDNVTNTNLARFEVEIFSASNLGSRLGAIALDGDRFAESISLNLNRNKPTGGQRETYYAIVSYGTSSLGNDPKYFLKVFDPNAIPPANFQATSVALIDNGTRLQMTFPTAPGDNYTLQTSTNMKDWVIDRAVPSQGTTTTVTVPVFGTRRFYLLSK